MGNAEHAMPHRECINPHRGTRRLSRVNTKPLVPTLWVNLTEGTLCRVKQNSRQGLAICPRGFHPLFAPLQFVVGGLHGRAVHRGGGESVMKSAFPLQPCCGRSRSSLPRPVLRNSINPHATRQNTMQKSVFGMRTRTNCCVHCSACNLDGDSTRAVVSCKREPHKKRKC